MYRIILERQVQKFLEKHKGQEIIFQFEKTLMELALDPYDNSLDIKMLAGLPNCYRIRIGKYRFCMRYFRKLFLFLFFKAGGRGDIYK